jgi:hypothetical protein
MNRICRWLLLPLLFAAISCGKKKVDVAHAISGKYIPLVDGVTAVGGDLDGVFSFMIVPTEAAQPVLGRQAFGGAGYEWQGVVRFGNSKEVTFEATRDRSATDGSIVIGKSKFDLAKGEIFRVASDSSVTQIPGSKAGRKDDPDNVKRLAEIAISR